MEYELIISPEAEADLTQSVSYYNSQRDGLGADFLACVEQTLGRIQSAPLAFAETHGTIRQTLVRRFPYVICYTIEGRSVHIVAVFHGHRDPTDWKRRAP